MQSTDVDNQHQDTASLVPEWPSAMEDRSHGQDDHLPSGRPSIVRRMLRSIARFSIVVLIGVGATLAWQSYGDKAREMLSTQFPSLGWLSVSTTTSIPMASIQHKMKFRPRRRFLRQRHPPLPLQLLLISRSLSLWLAISPQCGAA